MKKRKATFRIAVVLIGMALASGGSPAAGHPDGAARHNPLPAHATAMMRAFAADQQAPSAQAAVGLALCSGGFAGAYPCGNVDLLAHLPLAEIGGTRSNSAANDIWGWTDPLTKKEYVPGPDPGLTAGRTTGGTAQHPLEPKCHPGRASGRCRWRAAWCGGGADERHRHWHDRK